MSHCLRSPLGLVPRIVLAVIIAAVFTVQPGLSGPIAAAQPTASGTPTVWISETGQTISGAFFYYWLDNPEIGNPVSSAVKFGDLWTQWFEFARLEIEPGPFEYATVNQVHRHQIGRSFAYRSGYTDRLSAFQPLPEGPDRFFPETGHTLTMGFRTAYEQPGIAERLGLPISEEFDIGTTTYQFFEYGAFSWGEPAVAEFVPLGTLDAMVQGQLGKWQPQPPNATDWDSTGLDMMALSYLLPGARTIEVDLSDFRLTARVGDKVVLESVASIGSPNAPTVTGTFAIYLKYRVQSLSGIGWDGQPYSAPNTPWVMYFFEDYGFHASLTRPENGYGYMDSQGCVVLPMDVAEALWLWADEGTSVWVHE